MSPKEWPAHDYAIGSYIQATVANTYLPELNIKPDSKVLDIGCGNGEYTKNILKKVPKGSVLGIDPSENMLMLAQEVTKEFPNFSVEQADVLSMQFTNQFDCIVSFWCLQWTSDITLAFENISKALKKGGSIFALLPVGDDPYIRAYRALKESKQFKSLHDFTPPMNYELIGNLPEKVKKIDSAEFQAEICLGQITLPSLDIYRKFVHGLAFYQDQIPDEEVTEINEAVVDFFDKECQSKYDGEYRFNISIYKVTGFKPETA